MQSTLAAQKQLIDAADARERARDAALATNLAQIDKLKRDTQTPAQIVSDLQKYLALPQPIALVQQQGTGDAGVPHVSQTAPSNATGRSAPSARSSTRSRAPVLANSAPPSATKRLESQGLAPGVSATLPPTGSYAAGGPTATPANAEAPEPKSPLSLSPTSRLDLQPPPLPDAPRQDVLPANTHCSASSGCIAEIPAADLKPLYNYAQDCRACSAELAVAKQNASDDASKIAALTRERDAAVTAAKGGAFWPRLRRNILLFSVGAALGYLAASRR